MGKFNCPVEGARLTSEFGWRNIGRGKEWHQGVDLASPIPGKRVPVYAAATGEVTKVQTMGSYGKLVMIVHNIEGVIYETNYAHLDSYSVRVGEIVKQGQKIGVMGNTDNSRGTSNPKMGVHLHFEIHKGRWKTGQPNAVDPMKWIELHTFETHEDNKDYSKNLGYDVKGQGAYRLHTTPYVDSRTAEQATIHLVKDGYMKYAEVIGDLEWGYRVQSGKYTTQKDAEAAAIKIIDAKLSDYVSIVGRDK